MANALSIRNWLESEGILESEKSQTASVRVDCREKSDRKIEYIEVKSTRPKKRKGRLQRLRRALVDSF